MSDQRLEQLRTVLHEAENLVRSLVQDPPEPQHITGTAMLGMWRSLNATVTDLNYIRMVFKK